MLVYYKGTYISLTENNVETGKMSTVAMSKPVLEVTTIG